MVDRRVENNEGEHEVWCEGVGRTWNFRFHKGGEFVQVVVSVFQNVKHNFESPVLVTVYMQFANFFLALCVQINRQQISTPLHLPTSTLLPAYSSPELQTASGCQKTGFMAST